LASIWRDEVIAPPIQQLASFRHSAAAVPIQDDAQRSCYSRHHRDESGAGAWVVAHSALAMESGSMPFFSHHTRSLPPVQLM
jgi:hypothetical protein